MINVNNNYTDMKNLTPFKLCVLQNFPFIEVNFDAVTNYQLLCKVVEYLNNVIDNNNKQNDNITKLEQNFITLYNYVKDYFDNLDVQEEINKKLDEMAADGTLSELIQPLFDEYKKNIDSEVNTQNSKIIVLENRMDTFSSLPSGSTSGDAELIDIRVPASGFNNNKNYDTAGNAVRGEVAELNNKIDFISLQKNIFPEMTPFLESGRQLFNKNSKLKNGYYNASGEFVTNNAMGGHFIFVKSNSNICASGGFFFGAEFDNNFNFLTAHINIADGTYITTGSSCSWLYVATALSILDQLVVSYGDENGKAIGNSWDRTYSVIGTYIDGLTDSNNYKLPFIKKGKVRCNGGTDTVAAYYAGLDCKKKVNILQTKWIWERGTNSGTLALVINPNGVRYIKEITDLSLHLQITNKSIKLDVLGNRFGKYYYQTIINQQLPEKMDLDAKTEHTAQLIVNNNNCIVNVDKYSYNGSFIPDDKITSLDMVLGQYATFEHYCNGNRKSYAMPQITQFIARNNSEYLVNDDFNRQDGVLQNTPQGIPYSLISTLFNNG